MMVCAELSLDNCVNGFFLLEFIYSWADVPIAETDDVAKLLADRTFSYNPLVFPPKHADNPIFFSHNTEELSASSAIPTAPKATATAASKKKKKRTRALKITNTHMKEQGIDFSKDYIKPA